MLRALYMFTFGFWGISLIGCGYTGWPAVDEDFSENVETNNTGGPTGSRVLELPFAIGQEHQCTQGVGGTYSHTLESTYYGLDLDTGNSWDEEIFAPASGTAYVHYETTGFGYHLNIDLGDGTYVVLAHLAEIFVPNGAQVEVGQLVAYEGCTGSCSGDHLHLGLLEGDAGLAADHGVSVPTSFWLRDEQVAAELVILADSELICDLYSGHKYSSDLATVRWHPDGTLVKLPADDSVFVIDQNELAYFASAEVFASYNFDYGNVVPMTEAEFSCFGEGSTYLDTPVQYRAVEDEDGVTWLAYETEDNPGRYRKQIHQEVVDAVVTSWGISGVLNLYSEEAAAILTNYPAVSGNAYFRDGALVKEEGSERVFVIHESVALPFVSEEVLVLLGFEHQPIVHVESDDVDLAVAGIGSCTTGIGCVTHELVTSCGAEPNIDLPDDVIDVQGDDDDAPGDDDDAPDNPMHLEVIGTLAQTADYLWLAGELLDEYGTPTDGGFNWASLVYTPSTDQVSWSATVESDWTFRFSFEYQVNSVVNWSCVAPFPPGTMTMDVTATVDGIPVTVQQVDNYLGGCELYLEV